MSPSAKTGSITSCPKKFICVHFRKDPSSVHEWSTDQILSESVKAFSSYCTETVFRWRHLVAPDGTTWCQFSKGTFLCPWVIHTPNLKWNGQSVLKLSHGNRFQMATPGGTRRHQLEPVFERNLPLTISNPHIKFEVNWLKRSQVIARKPFSDGATWWHQVAPPGAHFWKEPSSVHE